MKVYKGDIVTCDEKGSVFSYLVEDKGKIVYTGAELKEEYKNLPMEDLKQGALIPAFSDTHIHFSSFSFFESNLDVRDAQSIDEIGQMIHEYNRDKNDKTILGFGASGNNLKEKRMINKEDIDKMFPNKPVMLIKYDGHASIINSKMMKLLPPKIKELRGFNEDSGQLFQEAFFKATDFITSKVSPVTLVKNMVKGFTKLADYGVGFIHTVEGVGFPMDMDVTLASAIARGEANNFQVRVFFQTMDVAKVQKRKLPRIGGCFATALDGCFGSEDAAMIEGYTNNSANNGILYYTNEEISTFCKKANRAGLQIELHAIGDAAFRQAVDCLAVALDDFPREDHRHTIIHACLMDQKSMEKCAQYKIALATQPGFLYWPQEPLPYLENILGKRVYQMYPFRDMKKLGLRFTAGSDAPCTVPNPIDSIYAVCNHYVPEQSLSIQDALNLHTREAAWGSFDEKERGSLEVGKFADMTILNRNPLKVKPEEIKQLKSKKLILQGKEFTSGQSAFNILLKGFTGNRKI